MHVKKIINFFATNSITITAFTYAKKFSLFAVLIDNDVTIWGFDNKLHSDFSQRHFMQQLRIMLKDIEIEERFFKLTGVVLKNEYNSRDMLSRDDILFLKNNFAELLGWPLVNGNSLSKQILESYHGAIDLYTIKDGSGDKKRIRIRDAKWPKI